jgi:hypothetical protein
MSAAPLATRCGTLTNHQRTSTAQVPDSVENSTLAWFPCPRRVRLWVADRAFGAIQPRYSRDCTAHIASAEVQ